MIVSTGAGDLRGRRNGDLYEFRGVRYATAARFGPPEPPKPWEGVADATVPGPMSPQLPMRTGPVTGEPDERGLVQGEDCLTCTVRTPSCDDGGRPVLVWIPGGAYVTGSESLPWYDTSALAAEGDVVTVSVTYRLGVLGWLRQPGTSPGNLGLLDLLAALRWVRDEIAAFGGDPARVTVMGHSAGAHAIACLLAVPGIGGLVRRAILQSGQLGLGIATERQAARTARFVTDALGAATDPALVGLDELMHAQKVAMRRAAGPGAVNAAPAFAPVDGVDPLPAGTTWADAARGAADAGIDLLVGATAREATTFVAISPALSRLWRAPVLGRLVDAGAAVATRRVFRRPARRLADDAAHAGARVHTYLVDWGAPESPLGACHTIELPFLLGTRESWERAPMLAGADWERDIAPLGAAMRAAWLGFARDGGFDPPPPTAALSRHSGRRTPGRVRSRTSSGPAGRRSVAD